MSTVYQTKTGHPVLGIILGILGIFAALLFTVIGGVIGGAVAVLLGLSALLLGVFARKGGRGIGAIAVGILAVIMAVVMTVSSVNMFTAAKKEAQNNPNTPLIARYLDKPLLGFAGILINIPKEEGSVEIEELRKELDLLNGNTEAPAPAAAPAEVPAEAPAD